jgi:hypothetical protein
MICIVGLLVVPDIVSQTVCPGADVVALKVRLISSTFTVTGLSTLIQTTFGYRYIYKGKLSALKIQITD